MWRLRAQAPPVADAGACARTRESHQSGGAVRDPWRLRACPRANMTTGRYFGDVALTREHYGETTAEQLLHLFVGADTPVRSVQRSLCPRRSEWSVRARARASAFTRAHRLLPARCSALYVSKLQRLGALVRLTLWKRPKCGMCARKRQHGSGKGPWPTTGCQRPGVCAPSRPQPDGAQLACG